MMVSFFNHIFAGKWDTGRALWRMESDVAVDYDYKRSYGTPRRGLASWSASVHISRSHGAPGSPYPRGGFLAPGTACHGI